MPAPSIERGDRSWPLRRRVSR